MPKTHPWLVTRAAYLAAHAPSVAPPSTLGVPTSQTEELDSQVLDHSARCQFPHSEPEYKVLGPCTGLVVAVIESKFCTNPTLQVCEVGRKYVEDSRNEGHSCRTCTWQGMNHTTLECWSWRLI